MARGARSDAPRTRLRKLTLTVRAPSAGARHKLGRGNSKLGRQAATRWLAPGAAHLAQRPPAAARCLPESLG